MRPLGELPGILRRMNLSQKFYSNELLYCVSQDAALVPIGTTNLCIEPTGSTYADAKTRFVVVSVCVAKHSASRLASTSKR